MSGCKPVYTPIVDGLKLKNETQHVVVNKKKVSKTCENVDVLGIHVTRHCLYA